jgi:hypothetical protein
VTGDDSTERLNRDTENTTKEFYSIDRQQGNVDLTIDTRLLSVTGREEIAKEIEITGTVIQSISQVLPEAEQSSVLGGVGTVINLLGTVSLDVLPSDKNHGGIIAQLPVLLGQGNRHHEVINGDATNISINGIMSTLEQAQKSANNIIGKDVDHGTWYNPTHGILSDLLEAGTDIIGNLFGYQTGVSKQNETFQAENGDKLFYLHSQGNLISQQGASNPNINNGHTFNSYGAPPTPGTSHAPLKGVGNIFADDENISIKPNKNDGDFVAQPLNILNPKNWGDSGHGTKYYGAAAGQPASA